jgi:hypothetical protein
MIFGKIFRPLRRPRRHNNIDKIIPLTSDKKCYGYQYCLAERQEKRSILNDGNDTMPQSPSMQLNERGRLCPNKMHFSPCENHPHRV